jgi:very-short-patch-repair endonuclease
LRGHRGESKLIVELDGAAHEGREDYDEHRTRTLELFD